ncbi:hypothetical protein CRV08_06050 [Halarcobacter ebronensis]|uniref:Uncharacterized protein n=1 Tax=Halarcobacter ebronensis TaxID=1462615 RepID=A0A4Q0YJA2_9BACT|nr:hypothetical protein [Halarcobacter ebronensis]RXJ68991.1 hypothetical protein CRV08_06050 [Halarcobacter ebronensis]
MNLTVVWNVWNNYEDVLLGSEILRLENESKKKFDELFLYSQGGYPIAPTEEECTYLDDYFNVDIDESHPLILQHPKFKGVFRVLNGIKQAYNIALKNDSDYVIVTNGDAWFLDIDKLFLLLNREDIKKSAVSARIGSCVGTYLNYGDFVPFFDDHFMILNVKKCQEHKVFDYDIPKAYSANFLNYGGIHYILIALMDERVPDGLFNIYTLVEDCYNHYGEHSGLSLLPWQYQPSTGFLHANCAQEPYLNLLRATFLEKLGFCKYPKTKNYCKNYFDSENKIIFNYKKNIAYFKKNFKENIGYFLVFYVNKIKYFLITNIVHKKVINHMHNNGSNSIKYYKLYYKVLPISFVSRRPKV